MTEGAGDWKMYSRKWVERKCQSPGGDSDTDESDLTIMTYNILNDEVIRPNYQYCSEPLRFLKNLRHPRIMEEVSTVAPDVVCFQEVYYKHSENRLEPDMAAMGYRTVFVESLGGRQGLATCFKKDMFDLLEEKNYAINDLIEKDIKLANVEPKKEQLYVAYIQTPRVALMTCLRHRGTGQRFWLCNIHVTWDGLGRPALQALQIASTCRELQKLAKPNNDAHIICGDFNTPPSFPAYSLLSTGSLECDKMTVIKDTLMTSKRDPDDMKLVEMCRLFPSSFHLLEKRPLTSAYKHVMNTEPELTNADDCDTPGKPVELCLDYLWYSVNHMTSQAVLDTPSRDVIMRDYALPSELFPSDHIPLVAKFRFL